MTVKAIVAAAALAGACVSDRYECATDLDCDLGVAGRCEVDHHCTAFDPACATTRRYTEHSGELSNACYEPVITDFNPCASGQPPASRDAACAADVCVALPSCCDTGWSAACVQRAQIDCDELQCDLRVAITATGATTDLFVLASDGNGITARQPDGLDTMVAYLAPAPGTTEPRLAGLADAGATLVIGEGGNADRIPLIATRSYTDLASVDFDRDLRDTVALSWQDPDAGTTGIDIVKLDSRATRSIETDAAFQRATWGDQDHDAFPDVVAGQGTRYLFLESKDAADHRRTLLTGAQGGITAGQAGVPALRWFDWVDLDGDRALDLIAFGNSVIAHRADPLVTDIQLLRIDCEPPHKFTTGNQCADDADINFAGAAVVQRDGTSELVIGNDTGRNLYRVAIDHAAGDTVTVTPMTFAAPCVGTSCVPIRAVVARDLDGDHTIDVIAIDAALRVYYTRSRDDATGLTLQQAQPLPPGGAYTAVRVSITGAPR